jgi:hypothetical protein
LLDPLAEADANPGPTPELDFPALANQPLRCRSYFILPVVLWADAVFKLA